MGGHTYYSFSIEPEKLLKIGYVLHKLQNKAAKANFSVAKAEYQLLCEAYERFIENDN